jgi:hypothetical protein
VSCLLNLSSTCSTSENITRASNVPNVRAVIVEIRVLRICNVPFDYGTDTVLYQVLRKQQQLDGQLHIYLAPPGRRFIRAEKCSESKKTTRTSNSAFAKMETKNPHDVGLASDDVGDEMGEQLWCYY